MIFNVDYWEQAKAELVGRDAVMKTLITQFPNSKLTPRGEPFVTLLRAIVGQQISVKAADAIWQRVVSLGELTPEVFQKHDSQTLRDVGLSFRKVAYCQAVCDYFVTNRPDHTYFSRQTDDALIKELTEIRGVGRWTAEMFLMFTLARPNIFPTSDIGLLRGLETHYGCDRLTPRQAHTRFFKQFTPWATVATWYLWRSLDPVEVNY